MAKSGPIILIEDDADDQQIFAEVLASLKMRNKVHWFTTGPDAFSFLKATSEQPFIIFCDINLPRETGVDFKKRIDADPTLRRKSIPFVFYSTAETKSAVEEAFIQLTVQGYFTKPGTFEETQRVLQIIFQYWQVCRHPNS